MSARERETSAWRPRRRERARSDDAADEMRDTRMRPRRSRPGTAPAAEFGPVVVPALDR